MIANELQKNWFNLILRDYLFKINQEIFCFFHSSTQEQRTTHDSPLTTHHHVLIFPQTRSTPAHFARPSLGFFLQPAQPEQNNARIYAVQRHFRP